MPYKIDFDPIEWTQHGAAMFKQMPCGNFQMRLLEFPAGFEEKEWCEKGHWGYVLEGQMTITFEKEEIRYQAGDGLYIPTGKAHRHKARLGPNERVKLILFEENK